MDLVHKISALRTRPPTYWLNAANQKLPVWTSGLLVIAIAWYSARLVWALVPQNNDFDWTVQPEPAANAVQATAGSGEVNFGKIAAANLFGVAGAEPTEPVNTTEDAPETRLNLKLRGTVAADDPDFAHVVFDPRCERDHLMACADLTVEDPNQTDHAFVRIVPRIDQEES